MKPKIAVLLAAYNGMSYLPQQVESILAQKEVELTLFVSVDFSSDGTEQWFDRLTENDSRIVVLQHGRHFGGAAKNFFRLLLDVDFSDFDYVAFADQDDIWLHNKLSRACEVIGQNKADAYSSNVTAFWPDGRQLLIKKCQRQVDWDFIFEAAGPGCTYVLSRSLAEAVRVKISDNWEESQKIGLHDWLVYAFARANNYKWVIDDFSGLFYRQHDHNQVGVNAGIKAFFHRSVKVINGWGMSQALIIVKFIGLENNPFVKVWYKGNRVGMLWLMLYSFKCRRRLRDKILFLFLCIVFFIIGRSSFFHTTQSSYHF